MRTAQTTLVREISVLVVDSHPLYRDSVARMINRRDDMTVVGESGNGDGALSLLRELEPDVCVLDDRLAGMNGRLLVEELEREHLPTRALVLSGFADGEVVFSMLEAGANGLILKTADSDQVARAIVDVAHGETVLPAQLHGGIAAEIQARNSGARPDLSEREREILGHVSQGQSAADVGGTLNLAPSTIKTHLTRIYDKLGVSERAAAVAQAIRLGIIE